MRGIFSTVKRYIISHYVDVHAGRSLRSFRARHWRSSDARWPAILGWHRIMNTNLDAAYMVTQKALCLLAAGASVVFIGSRLAAIGLPQGAHYTASKAGVVGLTRSLAKELGPRGLRVNLVVPGPMEVDAPMPPETRRRIEHTIALGRLGRPSDIAGVAVFIDSDLASFVSGETINVDGGVRNEDRAHAFLVPRK